MQLPSTEAENALSRRRFIAGAAALSLPAAGLLPAAAQAALLEPSDHVLLTILHTNDMHGHAQMPGVSQGLVRIAPMIRQIRADMPNVILLDAGDIIHGMPEEKEFAGRPLLTAMNTLGYDAATVGNHEFDFGPGRLRDAIDFARFPMLSANVLDERSGKPWADLNPYIVVEREGARVGVFGLTTPTTVSIEWPRTLAGVQFTDPHEAARKVVAHLRETEHVDAVIALSHLGYEPDRQFAAAVPGIDLILGGHSHTILAEQVWVNGTLIIQTGCYGKALSRVDLIVLRSGHKNEAGRMATINGRDGHWWGQNGLAAPLGKTYPTGPLLLAADVTADDPGIVAAYRPFLSAMRERLDEKLTDAIEPLPATHATRQETAVGDLLADAVRTLTGANVAFAASDQIDPNGLAAGPVRVDELYRLLGSYTRQHIVTVRAPGALLQQTLQRLWGDQQKLPVHLSGAVVSADGVMIGASPIQPDREYTVAAAAHVIQDQLYDRPGVVVLNDDVLGPTVRDAAIAYLRGRAPLRNDITPRWRNRANVSA